jgi:hypothetical protein
MIDALVSGHLHGAPRSRTTANGNAFATAVVRASTRDGSTVFCNVIAFAPEAITALLVLGAGDGAAFAGELTPKVYTPQNGEPRPSLDLLAHAVLTEYHVNRRRSAMRASEPPAGQTTPSAAAFTDDEWPPEAA